MTRKPLCDVAGFEGVDVDAVRNLIRTYTGDEYSCQDFVGIDALGRPCVILHFAGYDFDDDDEKQGYEVFYFSNLQTAEKAFLLLNEIDKVAFDGLVEEKKRFTDNKDLPF